MAISIAATCFVQKKRAKLAAARAKAMNDANHGNCPNSLQGSHLQIILCESTTDHES
jgi:hypothetical protein